MKKPVKKPKKAQTPGLFIGINKYPGGNSLAGCVNDANDWCNAFSGACTSQTLLLDADATKSNIVSAMTKTIASMVPGGFAVITYSGHGSWVPDANGDEPDGRDECLCPYDCNDNLLLDDEIDLILSAKPANSKILFVTDSCHSGSVYKMFRPQAASETRVKFLSPDLFASQRLLKQIAATPMKMKRASSGIIHLSGCLDTEYSYDTVFHSRPNGALTKHAISALRKGFSYEKWYKAIRRKLPSANTPQTPLLNAVAEDKKLIIPL